MKENLQEQSPSSKKCKDCEKIKETSEFYRDKYAKDGFTNNCIECRKSKWREWYDSNIEKARKCGRDGYYKRRERNIENSRKYKINNKEKVSEYGKRYRKEYVKRWYVKLKHIASGKNRRKKFRLLSDGSITPESISELLNKQLGKCNHCGINLEGLLSDNGRSGKHLDHIVPLSKGGTHVLANVQWLCWRCNLKKGDRFIG